MKKPEFLAHWAGLTPNQAVNPTPVSYKHQGSTYTEDSIRITGSQPFVDSVLSRMKDLLANEAGDRRLSVVYKESMDRVKNEGTGSYNVYIQVHERGGKAKQANDLRENLAIVAAPGTSLAIVAPAESGVMVEIETTPTPELV